MLRLQTTHNASLSVGANQMEYTETILTNTVAPGLIMATTDEAKAIIWPNLLPWGIKHFNVKIAQWRKWQPLYLQRIWSSFVILGSRWSKKYFKAEGDLLVEDVRGEKLLETHQMIICERFYTH